MGGKPRGKRFRFVARPIAETISVADLHTAERILARLVAEAFAADHPELFHPINGSNLDEETCPGKPELSDE